MQFMIFCTDSESGETLRIEHRDAHRQHLGRIQDQLMLAGPCPAGDGETRQASLLVFETEDAAAARALIESDPYYQAGVWDSVIVRQFNAVVGKWAP